jgi:hypothetical protein
MQFLAAGKVHRFFASLRMTGLEMFERYPS